MPAKMHTMIIQINSSDKLGLKNIQLPFDYCIDIPVVYVH